MKDRQVQNSRQGTGGKRMFKKNLLASRLGAVGEDRAQQRSETTCKTGSRQALKAIQSNNCEIYPRQHSDATS